MTFGDKISFPGSPLYSQEQNGSYAYWSVFESEISPSSRFTPTSTPDVSNAVSILAKKECILAMRGGGQMWWAGVANSQDGVTVDLSHLTQVKISKYRTITSVGGVARWEEAYYKLNTLNLAVVGVPVHDVGVAGLTLEGKGLTTFSSMVG